MRNGHGEYNGWCRVVGIPLKAADCPDCRATMKDERGPQTFPGQLALPGTEDAAGSPAPDRDSPRVGGSSLRVLAFDAGNTSGTCLYDGGSIVQGHARGRAAAYDVLSRAGRLDALAYERFIIRQPLKDEHATVVYVNGAIEYVAHTLGIPCYNYTPRQSKSRVSNDMLDSLGWYPKFGLRTGGHAADATRILVCTLIDNYPMELMDR